MKLTLIACSSTYQKWFELTSEMLDVLIWPLTTIIVLLLFRGPVQGFINRVIHLKTPIGSAEAAQFVQSKTLIKKGVEGIDNSISETVEIGKSKLQIGDKGIIDSAIENGYSKQSMELATKIVVQESGLQKKPSEDENPEAFRAVEYAALIVFLKSCELLYRSIFGGQIKILMFLNERSPQLKSKLLPHYEGPRFVNPEFFNSYSFEDYLGWLKVNDLIRLEGDQVEITHFGSDFLSYIIANQNLNKPY